MSRFRIIPPIETYPGLVRFTQTYAGKVCLISGFALALALHRKSCFPETTAILAMMTFFPNHRKPLLLAGTLLWLITKTPLGLHKINVITTQGTHPFLLNQYTTFRIITICIAIMFCAALTSLAKTEKTNWFNRRPVISLHIIFFCLLAICTYTTHLSGSWKIFLCGTTIVLSRYFWFLGYTLLDCRNKNPEPFIWQLGAYLPFWNGNFPTSVPFPKGTSYLNRIEAKDSHSLAIVQLKGIKLIYWSLILLLARGLFNGFVYGDPICKAGYSLPFGISIPGFSLPLHLSVPHYKYVITKYISGTPLPPYQSWMSLAANFISSLLDLSIWGHIIISTCRVAGFAALRNTYRPLESRSIAEFWNRYYYYFKEMLVSFFFYPTFFRFFKKNPNIRMFVATFAAAGLGNAIYHFIFHTSHIIQYGFRQTITDFQGYIFYCIVLSTAIGISQIRNRNKHGGLWKGNRFISSFSVTGFYCVLSIFGSLKHPLPLHDSIGFLFFLFGIS